MSEAEDATPDRMTEQSATDNDPEKVRGIVEAVLMTSDTPVPPGKLQALIKGVNGRDLRRAVDALNETYSQGDHAMRITEVAGGFQIVTLREFGPWVRKFHDRGPVRLSQAALETLAIIAFKQPVTRIEVASVRGVAASPSRNFTVRPLSRKVATRDSGSAKSGAARRSRCGETSPSSPSGLQSTNSMPSSAMIALSAS